jgi:hypothetical protein
MKNLTMKDFWLKSCVENFSRGNLLLQNLCVENLGMKDARYKKS